MHRDYSPAPPRHVLTATQGPLGPSLAAHMHDASHNMQPHTAQPNMAWFIANIIVQYYRRDFNRQAKLFIEVVGRVWPLLEQITGQFKGQCQRLLIIERDRPLNKATTSTHYVYVNTSHCLFCPLSRHKPQRGYYWGLAFELVIRLR
jgi:hypothetical protein